MALQNSRKGGRFVPASTDSLLSVTFVSLYYSVRPHLQLLLCLSTKGNALGAGQGCLNCGLPLKAAAQHRGLPRRGALSCKAGGLGLRNHLREMLGTPGGNLRTSVGSGLWVTTEGSGTTQGPATQGSSLLQSRRVGTAQSPQGDAWDTRREPQDERGIVRGVAGVRGHQQGVMALIL